MARALVVAPVLMLLSMLAVSAQGDVNSMRGRLEKRFEVLPIANGVVLTPRFRTDVRVDRSVGLDDRDRRRPGDRRRAAEAARRGCGRRPAVVVSGSRRRAGRSRGRADRRRLRLSPPDAPDRPIPPIDADFDADDRPAPRARTRDDIVRIGGSVTVDADETVRGDVVVIGGSATIDGQVARRARGRRRLGDAGADRPTSAGTSPSSAAGCRAIRRR